MMKTKYPNSWEDEVECEHSPALWSSVIGLVFTLVVFGFLMVRSLLTSRRQEAKEPQRGVLELNVNHNSKKFYNQLG